MATRVVAFFVALALFLASLGAAGARPASDWVRPIFGYDSGLESMPRAVRDRGLDMLENAGSTWTRVGFYWPYIDDRVKDARDLSARDWSNPDSYLAAVLAHRQTPIGALIGFAPYANGGKGGWYVPPDPSAFGAYCRDVVTRYKDRIHYWEVWNEPNGNFWPPKPDPAAYARLLRIAYLAIKSADPSAKVLFGGINRNDVGFLDEVYAATETYPDALANHHFFDILGAHPYSDDRPPWSTDPRHVSPNKDYNFSGLPKMKAAMEAHGESYKHVIVTEISWPIDRVTWTAGVGRERQAEYLTAAYRMAERWLWLDAMLWYGFRDKANEEHAFSLVNSNLSPRPSFVAYRRAALGLD